MRFACLVEASLSDPSMTTSRPGKECFTSAVNGSGPDFPSDLSDFRSDLSDSPECFFNRSGAVKCQIGRWSKSIQAFHPPSIHIAREIAGKRSIGVSIGDHDCALLERRHDDILQPVHEVRSVQCAVEVGSKKFCFFRSLNRLGNEAGGIPGCDDDGKGLLPQVPREQFNLSRLSGTVQPLENDKPARGVFAEGPFASCRVRRSVEYQRIMPEVEATFHG